MEKSIIKSDYAICFGEVLWDVFGPNKHIGGAPLNVCYHLTRLGVPAKLISQVGNDPHGEEILATLETMGLHDHYCRVTHEAPTSRVVVNLEANEASYEIVEPVAWDYIREDPSLIPLVQEAAIFVYGSLATRNELTRQTLHTYLDVARWKVFDVNLRQSHYRRAGIEQLMEKCDTLKVNDEELKLIGSWFGDDGTVESRVSAIRARFPNISEIILTMGANGARYFSDNQQIQLPGVPATVVSTVGCGDSFLAAFITYRLAGKPIDYCIQQALFLSSFVATQEGGCPPYPEDLMPAKVRRD